MSDGAPSTSGRGAAASGGASSGGLWPHAGSLSLPGYTHLSASTIGQLSTTQLALTIAGAAVTGAVVWHYTRDAYYAYVPPRVSTMGRQEGATSRGQLQSSGRQKRQCCRLRLGCGAVTALSWVVAARCAAVLLCESPLLKQFAASAGCGPGLPLPRSAVASQPARRKYGAGQ